MKVLRSLLSFFLISAFVCISCADLASDLSDFYFSTGGDTWKENWNWLSSEPICNNWRGIQCNGNGEIETIDMSNNDLKGDLPESIANFTSLKYLWLDNSQFSKLPERLPPSLVATACSNCGLSGLLPDTFRTLVNLESLYYGGNNFEGNIPKSWESMKSLQNIDLSGSKLSGQVSMAVSGWTNLKNFNLASNQLEGIPSNLFENITGLSQFQVFNNKMTGRLPESLCKSNSTLNMIYARTNQFEGQIPLCYGDIPSVYGIDLSSNRLSGDATHIFKLSGLLYLDLGQNMLTGIISDLTHITQLNYLSLAENSFSGNLPNLPSSIEIVSVATNQFSGVIPSTLGQLPNVKTIDLRLNRFIGTIPSFSGCPALTKLILNSNSLEGQIGDSLKQNNKLVRFEANDNNLTGSIPDYFGDNLKALRELQLKNNRMDGLVPYTFYNLDLYVLILSNNSFSETIGFLSYYYNLQNLELSNNKFTGSIPSFDGFYVLGRLLLNGNQFTGSIPGYLALPEYNPLSFVDLSDNQLTGLLPSLDLPPQLRVFNVSHNRLSGYIPPQFSQFRLLEVLDLSNNGFYGSLPIPLSQVTTLTELLLDNNSFTGEIPSTWASLINLKTLSMNNNSLVSKDLSNLSKLIRLEKLRLSDNKIEATIPESIGNITQLQVIDFSNNLLKGSLPSSFFTLRYLTQVNLKNNNLTGNLTSFSSDPSFVDLSGNSLEGDIGPVLDSLTSISVLDMSGNMLTGGVPDLSSKKQLVRINLSGNRISGSLQSFAGLSKLVELDLSNNQIIGSVPSFGSVSLLKLNLRNNRFNDSTNLWGLPSSVNTCDISNNPYECPLPTAARERCRAICTVSNGTVRATGRIRIEGDLNQFNSTTFLSTFSSVMNVSLERLSILQTLSGSVIVDLSVAGTESDSEGSSERIVKLMGSSPYKQRFAQNGIKVLDTSDIPPLISTSEAGSLLVVDREKSLSGGQIAGIVIGVSLFMIIVVVIVVFLLVRLKRAREQRYSQFAHIDMTDLNISSSAKNAIIDFGDIKGKEQIGAGAFGVVYKAEWRGINVAVKQIRAEHVTVEQVKDFLGEVGILQSLRSHPNVVLFLGITIPPQPLALVIELCEGGSLYAYLRSNELSFETKIKMLSGVATGMLHLHLEKVIHRDLAVRNILLTKFNEPKVADFGLSRQLDTQAASVTNSEVGPLKWMSPESILERSYSNKSDAWSFGVVIWEVLTVQDPFSDLTPVEAALQVCTLERRLAIPDGIPIALSNLMTACWKRDPNERPEFAEICTVFSALERNEEMEIPVAIPIVKQEEEQSAYQPLSLTIEEMKKEGKNEKSGDE
eukprot:TRINITY_DN997_c0_g1_i2.p1 TRINITY_DN997_c0_g1~~TRINITY_DN997_c0_g1_i2.p1  ORF type:complete len:1328 (+),score=430.37 TRINITY_DN997_c0_g1_i2:1731-5714(+)